MLNVADWLAGLGLDQYTQAFRDNDIDGEVLIELTAEDLTALGVGSIGHRRKLLAAIKALRESPPAPPVPAPTPVKQPAAASAGPADMTGAERRLLTIMFCDLIGSTELSTRFDPEDLREIIAKYHSCVAGVVTRFGGFVAKYMGDGVLAYFGYPQAHEDDSEQAVRAALAIVQAVEQLDLKLRLQVRLGIATGLVVVGDLIGAGAAQEQAVVGETPNLAARLQALASSNGIVIAETTRRQIGALFELRDLGPQSLKGFAGAPRAWEVLTESTVASRFAALRSRETSLVGREEEMELLLRRWGQAKSGEARIVLISAEPGIGKSRLTEALQERIAHEPHQALRFDCSPHHQDSAFHPIIAHLERAAGFARENDTETRRRKLAEFAALNRMSNEDLSLLADLLSLGYGGASASAELTPQRRKEKTFDLLIRRLETIAGEQPVLMVFEDLHWIDPTSRELLDNTLARIERLPVLLVATFRPEFQPPWVGQSHVTMLNLPRLGRREGAALIRQLAGADAELPADVLDEIIARTDGVPLFLEEVTKVVLEAAPDSGADPARMAISSIPHHRVSVPATLQASLLARLDRLGPAAREIAQTGAAIGREFAYDILLAATPRSEIDMRAALDRLVDAGLVFQRGAPPAADYQFKHALVQDTAYGTLLRGPRQALHSRIAAAIETRTPDRAEREPEILAYHWAEAGDALRAAGYWLQAGRHAAARSANVEAMAHLRRGIEAVGPLAKTEECMRLELALQLALGPAVMATRGFAALEAEIAYQRARELGETLGDNRSLFASVWGEWLVTGQAGGHRPSQPLVDELFRVAKQLDDPALELQAHHAAWATDTDTGNLIDAREHVAKGLQIYDPKAHGSHALLYGGHDPAVCGLGQGGIGLWALGYPEQARASVRQGISLAETLTHRPSLGHALWFAGIVYMLGGETNTVLDLAERLVALSNELGLGLYRATGGMMRGWARVRSGTREEGLAELRAALVDYLRTAAVFGSFYTSALVEAELACGQFDQAAAAANNTVERRGDQVWRSRLTRAKADLEMAKEVPDLRMAEQLYGDALSEARRMGAKSFELESALGLARLWTREGQQQKARSILEPVYSWFSEGFDTTNLKEARVLLQQLQ